MESRRAQLVLVFHEPPSDPSRNRDWQAVVRDQLQNASGSIDLRSEFGGIPMSIRVCSAAQAAVEGLSWQQGYFGPDRVVILEASVPFDLEWLAKDLESRHGPMSACAVHSVAENRVSANLEKRCGDLLLAMSMAVPGAEGPREAQCIVNGRVGFQHKLEWTDLSDARQAAEEMGWPPIGTLPLDLCLRWLDRIPGFPEGVPRGPAGRAIAALSHLVGFGDPVGSIALMWCMIGLEALYTGGREGLSEQLHEKVQVLLGQVKAQVAGLAWTA